MTTAGSVRDDHGALMDSIYRGQRHIYDFTRKYYLFGRDRLIEQLDPPPAASVLEIACGTGRNLALIARRWPGAQLHGLDISSEMLKSAATKLGQTAKLARGDAASFDPLALFGAKHFDRVVLSFATSMIPDWEAAIGQALSVVAPHGSLHIVDFGDMSGFPAPLAAALRGWLARFHVTPRPDLASRTGAISRQYHMAQQICRGFGGYYELIELGQRPGAAGR